MLEAISGRLLESSGDSAVVEVSGIALRLKTPPGTLRSSPGSEVRLYCHMLIREEQFHLYGFSRPEERDVFLTLLSVSGLGPEKARLILGSLSPSEIARAVMDGDARRFQVVKGVGTRLAQRVALELKGKVDLHLRAAADDPVPHQGSLAADLVTALTQLGFARGRAERAASETMAEHADATMPDLIKHALRRLQSASS